MIQYRIVTNENEYCTQYKYETDWMWYATNIIKVSPTLYLRESYSTYNLAQAKIKEYKSKIMKHAIVSNLPKKIRVLFDEALDKSYNSWIDEKGTKDNPCIWRRNISKLSYDEAFKIIQDNKPHWVVSFRGGSYFGDKDYWEFGGCNIGSNDYGEVFIWIQVEVDIAKEIFKKYNLEIKEYERKTTTRKN